MSITEMVASQVAERHGCEIDEPCLACVKTAKSILHKIALEIHMVRLDCEPLDNAPIDTWYAGIIKARSIVLDGQNL